jgi:undecaprenyl-diphosphatase
MDSLQAIILGIIQGITEFLPISSTAHLLLFSKFADLQDQGLAFDVALHLGSIVGVVVYFKKEIVLMVKDWFASIFGKGDTFYSRLAWYLIIATIPVGLSGLFFHEYVEGMMRSAVVIAIMSIIFGILLGLADIYGGRARQLDSLNRKDAIIIGLFQALAIVPGVSRSGITMTAGRMMGLSRHTTTFFAFLMSIPVILLASLLQIYKLISMQAQIEMQPLAIGFLVSAFVSFVVIFWFIKTIEKIGMLPFVIYRIILGGVLLYVFL